MNRIDDGGPVYLDADPYANSLTLRDYFAARALSGFANRAIGVDTGDYYARRAYEWADAMIEARKS